MDLKEKIFGTAQAAEARGEQALHRVADAAEQGKDKVVRDLHAVISDAQALLKQAQDTKDAAAGEVADALDDGVAGLRHRFASMQSALDSKARETREATDRYVRQNPWQSIGIASVASFCIAALIVGASMAPYFRKLGGKY